MITEEKFLPVCVTCGAIRVLDEPPAWIKREEDPRAHYEFMRAYSKRLSHTYCPEDAEKEMKEIEEFKKRLGQ